MDTVSMKHEHSILLVDDDSASAQTMRVILEGAGRQIATVSDGHEALNLLSTERFDLAIFELTPPGLSGAKLYGRNEEKTNMCSGHLCDSAWRMGVILDTHEHGRI